MVVYPYSPLEFLALYLRGIYKSEEEKAFQHNLQFNIKE